MTAQPIYVANRSTLVSDQEAATMSAACAKQIAQHLAPAWNVDAPSVTFTKTPPAGARVVTLLDTLDQADALGWHTETGARQYGVVGCKPELDNGGHPLTGPYSVASVLSHELMELTIDPRCNLWADTGKGYLVSLEVGDPVQSDHYDIDGVTVSSFVLPAWFDPQAPRGTKVDYLGTLHAPFTMSRAGYWVQMRGGQTSQRFGEAVPDWVKAKKQQAGTRTIRRVNAAEPAGETP